MPLVDYPSDSEDDGSDTEIPKLHQPQHVPPPAKPAKKQIIVDLPKPVRENEEKEGKKRHRPDAGVGEGLFAILPPPKRSKPSFNGDSNASKESLHQTKDGEVKEIAEFKNELPATSFMPRSTQSKAAKSSAKPLETAIKRAPVSLFLLNPDVARTPASSITSTANPATYVPLTHDTLPESLPSEHESVLDTTIPTSAVTTLSTSDLDTYAAHILEGRHRKNRTIEIMDFNAAEMYAKNAADKASGLLRDHVAPVRAIGTGRHQLTQLLNNVQDQRESLEEAFAQGRRVKRESAAKYGW